MSATPRASAMPWASGVGAGGQAELGAGGRPGGHLQLLGHGGHGGRHRALRLLRAQHLRDAPGPRDRALRRLALRRIARRRAAAAAKAACARAAQVGPALAVAERRASPATRVACFASRGARRTASSP